VNDVGAALGHAGKGVGESDQLDLYGSPRSDLDSLRTKADTSEPGVGGSS
jgi:hypothetical protein